MEREREDLVSRNLSEYKRKFYANKAIRGSIIFLALAITYFLVITSVEFSFRLESFGRGFLFFSFIGLLLVIGYKLVGEPVYRLLVVQAQMSDEEAAIQIGRFFPNIADKLLNTIQLRKGESDNSSLLAASIQQRTKQLSVVPFPTAIDFSKNQKYLRFLLPPTLIILLIFILIPPLITESTDRIVKFNDDFVPEAPFFIEVENEELTAFRNEDFLLKVATVGRALPEEAFIVSNGRKIKLDRTEAGHFSYQFNKLQRSTAFYIEASGFESDQYSIEVRNRPNLRNYNVVLDFPRHTKKQRLNLTNAGNLQIPEGTSVTWQIGVLNTEEVMFRFESEQEPFAAQRVDNQVFELKKRVLNSDGYEIELKNEYSSNKERIAFDIDVIQDEYPAISLEPFQDTVLFNYIILGGNIQDDYGITQLELRYKKESEDVFKTMAIPFSPGQTRQSFYQNWQLDSLKLDEGESLEYFVQVWDNDGVNGRKSSKSGNYVFKVPTRQEVSDQLEKDSQSAENQIDKSVDSAEELQKQLDEIEQKLKSKKQLDWQDEKLIEELMKKREQLQDDIRELQEKNNDFFEKKERFNEQSDKIKEKAEQLKKLMDELLDEETKKLYEELKKLLEEKSSVEDVQKMIDDIDNKEENIEKELERALELFKRMKMDYKLDEIVQDLDEVIEKQEALPEESQDKQNTTEDLQEKQSEIQEEFEEIQEDLEELNDMNQDLQDPSPMEETESEESEVEEQMQDSQENLQNNKRKKASESQKGAVQKMKQLQQKMQNMQMSMEMTMMEENLDDLRDILDNLIKLSFDQEGIMNDFKKVNQSDPRFVTLSQDQLQLKDDAQIIEDSLIALANRVFQIQSFVTREVDAMNDHMDESIVALKERNKPLAVSKQQFTMTSMNNLALLLDDVMQQMQQAMAEAKGMSKGDKKGKKQQMPGLSDLQKQLNKKIDDLKKSGKSGRQLSEELAKLAAEQEMIRQELGKMQESMEEGEGGQNGNLQQLMRKMEETETDLVNKQLTEQMKRRQKDILTRLLKAEDAQRERELDDQREGTTAKELAREMPPAYEQYIKAKEKEIELLKTIPLQMNPYYKKEVNEYFRRLGNQDQQ